MGDPQDMADVAIRHVWDIGYHQGAIEALDIAAESLRTAGGISHAMVRISILRKKAQAELDARRAEWAANRGTDG